jgi:hypothetical protein
MSATSSSLLMSRHGAVRQSNAFADKQWFAAARAGYCRLDEDECRVALPIRLERFEVG